VEEASLWELPWGAETVNRAGEKVLLEPAVTIAALRPDLERLLREGAVELYEIDDPNQVIDLHEALRAIAEETSWATPDKGGRPWALVVTELGEAEYLRDYPPPPDDDSY
jgi:hypothetical protein